MVLLLANVFPPMSGVSSDDVRMTEGKDANAASRTAAIAPVTGFFIVWRQYY
jgi:hypothetical protein